MVFSHTNSRGQTYYLHSRRVTLKNNREQTIYFFGKQIKEGAQDALPLGYVVAENSRTGLPVLKKG